jgi:hypothetical protein
MTDATQAAIATGFHEPATATPGWERFTQETVREVNLDEHYNPYRMQQNFHASPIPNRLLGGAAGPGKSTALIMDHLVGCNEHESPTDAAQVHTLLLRRTFPQLEGSLITRFREKVPRELYAGYNDAKKMVTWLNGATTQFGAMQYEMDVWKYQGGQYKKIGFDELTQFTFYQWSTIGAWNRCPVGPTSQDGASNPVGIGAMWVKSLFIDHKPCREMDDHQKAIYAPADYAYFPCTYLDNPIYANDPQFIKKLESYPAKLRDALKFGLWGAALGTYFDIWDEAVHAYPADQITPEPWWPKWLSADWGFEHNAAIYWHTIDSLGIARTYRELVVNHQSPGTLAESISKLCYAQDGTPEKYSNFWLSFDAFAEKTGPNTIARQMWKVLQEHPGIPEPTQASRDKMGGEQLMYELLKPTVRIGAMFDEEKGLELPVLVPGWQVSDACPELIATMPMAPRDEKKIEQIAEFLGNDPIDGARYGIYGKLKAGREPIESQIARAMTSGDPTIRAIQAQVARTKAEKKARIVVRPGRWRPRSN